MKLHAKQLHKLLASYLATSNITVEGSSSDITNELTTACLTGGFNSSEIPLASSIDEAQEGVIISGAFNRVKIVSSDSLNKITSNNQEVYGRITESVGVYTLSFYTLSLFNVETPYVFTAEYDINTLIPYRFALDKLPTDVNLMGFYSTKNTEGVLFKENLTIGSLNSISNLTKTPVNDFSVELIVNGKSEDSGSTPAPFTIVATTISWSVVNSGYNIETTDKIQAVYKTLNSSTEIT